jgi:predicted DNA-binding protein (UPF0251 family)
VPDAKGYNSKGKSNGYVDITVDEYETVRLIDYVGLTQQECAKQMQVARSTVTAVYFNARYKIADSIVNNKALKIEGGNFELCPNSKHCCGQCGKNRCGRCKHGTCDRCVGVFHPPGQECFVVQYN